MKLALVISLALAALPLVSSQDTDAILQTLKAMPQCAQDCFVSIVPTTTCSLTDQTCMCENTSLQDQVEACVVSKCTIKESLFTKNLTAVACNTPIRDKSTTYMVVSTVFAILSGLFIVQRLFYKVWAKINLAADDWITIIAFVVGLPSTVLNATCVSADGLGRDIWTLEPYQITNFLRCFFIIEVTYIAEVAIVKAALLVFYIRIFPRRLVRHLLWGTMAFTFAFGLAFFIVVLLQCRPLSFYWVMWDGEHEGTCLDVTAIAWSNAVVSIVLDGWMLAIPLWQLGTLGLDWRRKIGVALMFCMGTLVSVVSVLRLQSLIKFGNKRLNPSWDFYDIGIWSTVEINVAMICICLPSFRLLLVRIFPKLQGTTQRFYGGDASKTDTNPRRSHHALGGIAVTSQAERSDASPGIQPNRIALQTSYTVEYGDNDETELVHMKDLDVHSSRSDMT